MEHQENINKKITHLEYSNDEKFTSDSGSTASSNYLIDSNVPGREVNSTSADSSPSTTPKRHFTPNIDENKKFSQETSNPISRPQSVIPMSSASSQRIDIEENLRPKTSLNNLRAQVPYDEIPIKSKYNSRETGINLNEFENNSKDDEFDEVDDVQEQRTVRPIIKMKSFRSKRPLKTSIPIKKSTIPAEKEKPEKPKDLLNNCLRQMDSSNWETTISGLKLFVRLIQKNPEIIESQLHTFSMVLGKHIRNLRSQVSRQACITSQEFFPMLKTSAKSELEADELALQLFYRTADTNKFLRGDANRALEVMCFNLSPTKVINILCMVGATHQNAIVKTVAARLLSIFVNRFSCDKIFSSSKENRDKIILTGANLLMEGSLETRNYAKEIFKELSLHPNYDKIILDVIPAKTYRNIEKTLKSLR